MLDTRLRCMRIDIRGSNAATLLVDDGQLIGARDVIVDGKALNVDFVDSSCFRSSQVAIRRMIFYSSLRMK